MGEGARDRHVGARSGAADTLRSGATDNNPSLMAQNPKRKKRTPKAQQMPAPASPPADLDGYIVPAGQRQVQFLARYPELRRLYLQHLARYGSKSGAAAYIRIGQDAVHDFASKHPWFKEQCETAEAAHKDLIEKTIHQRAIEGWDEPRFGKLGVIGKVRRFSDQLLVAYARRHIPEYREGDRTTQLVEGEVTHKHQVDARTLTPQQREALRLLLGTPEEPKEEIKQITVEPSTNGSLNGHSKNGEHE